MYATIRGKLTKATPIYVIVETGGIGYKLFIPACAHSHLPQVGEDVLFHTAFIVRELSQTLYGFTSEQEKDVFEVLLNTSGIGPKIALSILGHLPTDKLYEAIANSDIALICKVPGIGRKSAERLIIEVKDKLVNLLPNQPSDFAINLSDMPQSQTIQDAMSALINLGYNQATAQKAIKKTLKDLPESTDLAMLITASLKHI